MSMRIGNQADGNTVDALRSSAGKPAAFSAKSAESAISGYETDQVNLSDASNLVALAKTLAPADRQAKLVSLSNQVSSGEYRPEAAEIGKALIDSYTKG